MNVCVSIAEELPPDLHARILFQAGEKFELECNDWQRAVQCYEEAAKYAPGVVRYHYKVAIGYKVLKKWDKAIEKFKVIVTKIHPKHKESYFQLGMLYFSKGALSEAEYAFRKAIEIDETYPEPYHGLGIVFAERYTKTSAQKDKQAAIKNFTKHIQLARKGVYVAKSQSFLYELQHGKAGKKYNEAVAEYQNGSYRKCYRLLKEIIADAPSFQEPHYLLGLLYNTRSASQWYSPTKAMAEWGYAYDVKEAQYHRGLLFFNDVKLEKAAEAFKKAIEIDINYQEAHYQLGMVYALWQQASLAIDEFQKAISIAHESEWGKAAARQKTLLEGKAFSPAEIHPLNWTPDAEILDVPDTQKHLDQICRLLVSHSDAREGWINFSVRILNSPNLRTISLPDGRIYVYKGFLSFVREELDDSDDVMAFILAHEIAHVIFHHAQRAFESENSLLGIIKDEAIEPAIRSLSQADEYEADRYGVLYAYRAGYNPYASVRFLEKLIAIRGDIAPGGRYPTHSERIERIHEYLTSVNIVYTSFEKGLKALMADNCKDAIRDFTVFLRLFPNSIGARNNLGVAYHKQGYLASDKANTWKKTDDIDLDSYIRYQVLARTRGDEKIDRNEMLQKAMQQFNLCISQNPSYAPAINNLASVYNDMGKVQQAKELYQKAIKVSPNRPEPHNNLGVLYCKLAESNKNDSEKEALWNKATQQFKKAVKLNANYADPYYNLALIHETLSSYFEAAEAWREYLRLAPQTGWRKRAIYHLENLQTKAK